MAELDPVALTGRLTAALRAEETDRPDALFTDPYAAKLAGDSGKALLAGLGENQTIAVRTRHFDDQLAGELAGGDRRQLVIVAAGMDARAYRLDLAEDTRVFELDREDVLRVKEELVDAAPRVARTPVGVDLAGDWAPALLEAGFDPARPSCWLAEGLTQYLSPPDVLGLLDRITALSAPGSTLLIDMVGQSFLDSPMMKPMLDWFADRDAPWIFGTDRPEDLLAERGWRSEVTLISEISSALGRWPFPVVPRETPGVPQGYFVRARR
ncbi:class I SAM-dependent methyltransferase [Amycolatopsis sp. CA-230715]|uniref:class I SAM-dependent methyltransferase n=1 Tax=Amycolatopsis sp. CA-230715 TaxID=2745196 RepID=UPI001C02DFD7|nr:SAM-dependent methyltransferase [Amycolatopsis sp. CA-230715]QWF83763.1 Putative S-adenosyl-L-methionine-dependent methyltransferase [Amycolatopsis sp. CA-230715]